MGAIPMPSEQHERHGDAPDHPTICPECSTRHDARVCPECDTRTDAVRCCPHCESSQWSVRSRVKPGGAGADAARYFCGACDRGFDEPATRRPRHDSDFAPGTLAARLAAADPEEVGL